MHASLRRKVIEVLREQVRVEHEALRSSPTGPHLGSSSGHGAALDNAPGPAQPGYGREAAKHAKMKAALAEKLAMEAEEAARREQQVTLKESYKANIETWKNKNKGNIRGLLGSLHTVLWPDSGWQPVSVGDLLESVQVKKVYMKANLLVHPDKVRQRNGSAEQVAIADMVFDVLKDAWNAFR
ncbi:hypothetical protein GPECTOR_2g1571 [Gonium pectorale]|uniref:J domain-containing protein n=1 Tax=Gonium pectorale TaxID=33097 RepID=A0A150H1L9_GONPE|nr:hypothetical protein GPECTOR_2g1571 [Gonium pectorale]|eukprot:KXZ56019.1 hypothetical protein GPECTOR_2g1571 [Gonium pectorale]